MYVNRLWPVVVFYVYLHIANIGEWVSYLTKVLYGSVLHYLVNFVLPDSPGANLAAIWIQVKRLYRELGVPDSKRYSTMKLTMFKASDGSCKLRGIVRCVFCSGAHMSLFEHWSFVFQLL